jgi:hypothetical protein
MSCCRTGFVILSLILSSFFFLFSLFLQINSIIFPSNTGKTLENSQNQPQNNNLILNQDNHHGENPQNFSVHAYMPDAKSIKFQTQDLSSYYYKVSTEFLKRKFFIFFAN